MLDVVLGSQTTELMLVCHDAGVFEQEGNHVRKVLFSIQGRAYMR